MRRKERQRDEAFALELLRNCEYAVVGTVNDDGTPYGVPVSPVLVDRSLYFHCATVGLKNSNLLARFQVCVTCVGATRRIPERFTTAYSSAIAYGEASQVTGPQEKIMALTRLCEKYKMPGGEALQKELDKSLAHTAIFKIVIREVTGKESPYTNR